MTMALAGCAIVSDIELSHFSRVVVVQKHKMSFVRSVIPIISICTSSGGVCNLHAYRTIQHQTSSSGGPSTLRHRCSYPGWTGNHQSRHRHHGLQDFEMQFRNEADCLQWPETFRGCDWWAIERVFGGRSGKLLCLWNVSDVGSDGYVRNSIYHLETWAWNAQLTLSAGWGPFREAQPQGLSTFQPPGTWLDRTDTSAKCRQWHGYSRFGQ